MKKRIIYADYNATTPLGHGAMTAMSKAFERWGNPSSAHQLGREADELLENSRRSVAGRLGVDAEEVVFTSGGSEANTLALLGSFWLGQTQPPFRLLTSQVEHSSVIGTVALLERLGAEVKYIRLDRGGSLDPQDFESQLDQFQPNLVSLMTANNETGVRFPIVELAKLCRDREIPLHTDAVQAFGKIPSEAFTDADFISVSAHKIYGPKGVGALIVRRGRKLVPTHYGGSQEIKRRGGTQNMMGIAGFAGAAEEMVQSDTLSALQRRFEAALRQQVEELEILGAVSPRIPNTTSLRISGIGAEVLLGALDLEGICISAGSACSSGSISPSHVLLAMGLSAGQAKECVRVSWGRSSTEEEVDEVVSQIVKIAKRIRERKSVKRC